MRGEWYTTSGGSGELLAMVASVAVGGLVIWLIITYLWLIAVIAGLALLVSGTGLWLLFRHGADAAVVSRPVLPSPAAAPLPPSRPAEALPASQQLHIHLHGMTADEAAERLTAIREAGYRAWPDRSPYRRNQLYDPYRRDRRDQ